MTEPMSILASVEKIVRDIVTFDGTLDLDTTFDELGFDSMDTVEAVLAVEETFEIELTDDEVEHLETVGHLVSLVERKRSA